MNSTYIYTSNRRKRPIFVKKKNSSAHYCFWSFHSPVNFKETASYFFHFMRKCAIKEMEIKSAANNWAFTSWKLHPPWWKWQATDKWIFYVVYCKNRPWKEQLQPWIKKTGDKGIILQRELAFYDMNAKRT